MFLYRHEYESEAPRASCHVYCIKHEDFSCYMLYSFILSASGSVYVYVHVGDALVLKLMLVDVV